MFAEIVISLLVLTGAAFALIGSIGLVRLPDVLTRLHGPTKATTLGLGALVIAALVHASIVNGTLSLRELAISLFLFITAPVAAHLLGKAALKAERRSGEDGGRSG